MVKHQIKNITICVACCWEAFDILLALFHYIHFVILSLGYWMLTLNTY